MSGKSRHAVILRHVSLFVLGIALLASSAAQAQCGPEPYYLRLFCGDCNLDNRIDNLDAQAAADHASGAIPITGPRRMGCDVDRNGIINVLDAQMIAQVAVGIIPPGWRGCPTCGDCSGSVSPPFTPDGTVDNNDLNALVWEGLFGNSLFDSGHAACDLNGDTFIDTAVDYSQLAGSCHFVAGGPFPVCGLCGDCDLDGDVDGDDAQRAADAAVGSIVLNGLELGLCDIDQNQTITVIDALLIAGGNPQNCLARP